MKEEKKSMNKKAPDIAKSSQLRPDLVMNDQHAPEIIRDSKKLTKSNEDLDLDLDNLELNEIDPIYWCATRQSFG
uniref:Uncharacterized protein n=1 Tax=Romanomermis culicivorax TaxID=13658 RepID=A0A915KVC2_ROMCU